MVNGVLWASPTQHLLHLLVAGEVHGVGGAGAANDGVHPAHRVPQPLVADDLGEGVRHVPVVVPRVRHQTLHPGL